MVDVGEFEGRDVTARRSFTVERADDRTVVGTDLTEFGVVDRDRFRASLRRRGASDGEAPAIRARRDSAGGDLPGEGDGTDGVRGVDTSGGVPPSVRSVAINVGANTNAPGFRAPVFPNGDFEFVPIPETEPTRQPVPTYGDLSSHLRVEVPASVRDTPVHLDPEFAEYPFGEAYTYGDPHGVKARPLSELSAGDLVFFYATLSTTGDDPPAWQPPSWGAYLVGQFRLASDPVTDYDALEERERTAFASNAHVRRAEMDAAVLLRGDADGSRLYEWAVPLSASTAGVEPNRLVTDWSADSGNGPWWRRPLRFDAAATAALCEVIDERAFERVQG